MPNMGHCKTICGQRLGATLLAEKRNFQTLPSTSSIIEHGLEACLDFGIEEQILLGEIRPLLIHSCHASLSNGLEMKMHSTGSFHTPSPKWRNPKVIGKKCLFSESVSCWPELVPMLGTKQRHVRAPRSTKTSA